MDNVVKLILICQVKDDNIPQLIPLFWLSSVFICFLILIVIVDLFFYKTNYDMIISNNSYNRGNSYLW